MKKLLFIALLFASCTFTKQQKAEKLIKDYLKNHLNDPDSYESVKFGDLTKVFGTEEVLHTYRVKNSFGGIVTKSDWFQIDNNFTKASCCFAGPK